MAIIKVEMKKKAVIISIKGYHLNKKEELLFENEKPWGVILFKRNIKTFKQIKSLIKKIKTLTKDNKFPILIDEEGEKVSRLSRIINNHVSQKVFGDIYRFSPNLSAKLYSEYISNLCQVFKKIGININTVPVLDILREKTNKIIGNRSFSSSPLIVKKLGHLCLKNYTKKKIGTVIKHIPGHGCSTSDSHLTTPKVKEKYKILNKVDFFPFKSNCSLFAMTAHIVYLDIDKKNVATFSKKIIKEIIRRKFNFKGILISDDISMQALRYDIITNAKKSISAGCNLVLYCAGNHKESKMLLKAMPFIDLFTQKKTSEFYKFLS